MPLELTAISSNYEIGVIRRIKFLTQGKSTKTWKIETENEAYVMKALPAKESANFAYNISLHILQTYPNLTSEFLLSKNNTPYLLMNDTYYSVQSFITHKDSTIQLEDVLSDYNLLRNKLACFSSEFEPNNRFTLSKLWKESSLYLLNTHLNLYKHVSKDLETLLELDSQRDTWIHGDLGSWNMLQRPDGSMSFIDFDEARVGPRYLDLAAIYSSFIKYDEQRYLQRYTEAFLEQMSEETNQKELLMTIKLWILKGLLTSAKTNNQAVKHFYHIYQFIDSFNSK